MISHTGILHFAHYFFRDIYKEMFTVAEIIFKVAQVIYRPIRLTMYNCCLLAVAGYVSIFCRSEILPFV